MNFVIYNFTGKTGAKIRPNCCMYIEEIILEGFKTYVNRTVISAFDPQFNAITGFNGSGKSNILDGIQFLLGSTNKEMLRLKSNFTEVIYKQGCSGIEKASVSIKFRCFDKSLRPTAYQNCEQLLVTRQITKDKVTKFFVNGLASNLTKVRNLFRSVHLNIENPHFLVKQGQITKIINLKPQQLLGMIEETAGTAIYNKTKMESENMINRKKIKLESIEAILKESIMPQMEKLKSDRRRYIAYKDKEVQMKQLNESIKTYELVSRKQTIAKKEIELHQFRENLETRKIDIISMMERSTEIDAQMKILRNKNETSVLKQFSQLFKGVEEKRNECRNLKKRLEKFHGESLQAKQEMNSHEELIARRKQELLWKQKEELQQERHASEIGTLLEDLNQIKDSEDATRIIEKQLRQETEQCNDISNEINEMHKRLSMLEKEQQSDRLNKKEMKSSENNMTETLNELQAEVKTFDDRRPPPSVQDPEITNTYLLTLENQRKLMLNSHFQLRFSYNDPSTNFDRSKVKGKLFTLFKVKQKVYEKALEVGVGGKLHNIVVENQIVSKLLIERETFGKNVSIIPNNKIRYKALKHQAISEAKRIANQCHGLAKPAYELIEYDQSLSNSIMFGFSSFIVCSTAEIARKIAYHPQGHLSCKCVTYEGDIFDKGTLTGGHMNPNTFILRVASEFRALEENIEEERAKFNEEKKTYDRYVQQNKQFLRQKKQMEMKQNRIEKLKQTIAKLSVSLKKRNFAEEMQAIRNRISALKDQLQQHRAREQDFKAKLSTKSNQSASQQRKQLAEQKKQQENKLECLKKQSSMLEVQISNMYREIEKSKSNETYTQQQIQKCESALTKSNNELTVLLAQFEKVEDEKKRIERQEKISESKIAYLSQQDTQLKNDIRKIENEINHLNTDLQEAQRIIQSCGNETDKILEECPWLDRNKEYELNTSDFDHQEALREYRAVSNDVDKLRKTAKVTIDEHSYGKLQEQYESLLKKKDTLMQDRITLLNNMKELDEKRMKTLENCYEVVRENLGKIFNDLLPGATAHLNLIDQSDVTQGAELQVQFNKIRKELSELSGGQRSLLALSFILALLLYKPSPFYILDQIDSALDLSHTENIGYMISQRFPQSQFIIISLKEGMFQNANVLYKVHFSEGESKVDRQTIKKK